MVSDNQTAAGGSQTSPTLINHPNSVDMGVESDQFHNMESSIVSVTITSAERLLREEFDAELLAAHISKPK